MKLIIYFSGTGEDEITSTKSSIKEWTTASKDKCLNCDKRVSMNHRHHCRICGQGHFCDNCSPKRSFFDNLRVCDPCVDKYQNYEAP